MNFLQGMKKQMLKYDLAPNLVTQCPLQESTMETVVGAAFPYLQRAVCKRGLCDLGGQVDTVADGRFVLVRNLEERGHRRIVFHIVGAVESCKDLNYLQVGLQGKVLPAEVDMVLPLDRRLQRQFGALYICKEGCDGSVHDVDPGLRQHDVGKTGGDVGDAPKDIRRGLAVHVDAVNVVGAPYDTQQTFKHAWSLVELEAEGQGKLFLLIRHRPAVKTIPQPQSLAVLRHTVAAFLSVSHDGADEVVKGVQLGLVKESLAAYPRADKVVEAGLHEEHGSGKPLGGQSGGPWLEW